MKHLIISVFAPALLFPPALLPDTYGTEGVWYNAGKTSKVQIYKTSTGTYAGKIVWLKETKDPNGKPRADLKNPDENLRSRPLMNLVVVKGLVSKGSNKYDSGTIYDPKSGNTYSSKAEVTGPNTLKLRGFIGISLVGRTETWTRATN